LKLTGVYTKLVFAQKRGLTKHGHNSLILLTFEFYYFIMLRKSILATLFFLFCLQSFSSPTDSLRLESKNGKKFIVHRVIKSESLSSISKKYGVNESEVLSNNQLLIAKVYEGQVLKIPVNESKYGAVAVAPVKPMADSKLPLAKTLPTLEEKTAKKSEPIIKEEPVKVSPVEVPTTSKQTELTPAANKIEKSFKVYVVASPQTVQHLSESFEVNAADVIALNELKNYNLKEGQKIKIPMDNSPAIAKAEIKPTIKAVVKEDLPPVNPKPAPVTIVAVKPVANTTYVKPAITSIKPQESKEEKKAKYETLSNKIVDTAAVFALRKSKREADFARLDSMYTHPDGVAYKAFDYRQTDYQFDLYSMRLAEANAIEVPTTNQSKGYGDKNTTHCVKMGETLASIAKKYKITTTDIINWNGLTAYRVKVGQDLVINAARGDISPYVRTIANQVKMQGETAIVYENIHGLAQFDSRVAQVRGVYANNIEKGKFVYIVNKDKYREDFAIVIGPLPKGTPKEVIVIVDAETAKELAIEKSWVNVELYYGTAVQDVANKETAAKNK